jgi:hypothetical protein
MTDVVSFSRVLGSAVRRNALRNLIGEEAVNGTLRRYFEK